MVQYNNKILCRTIYRNGNDMVIKYNDELTCKTQSAIGVIYKLKTGYISEIEVKNDN